jgi:hypothetical protein
MPLKTCVNPEKGMPLKTCVNPEKGMLLKKRGHK